MIPAHVVVARSIKDVVERDRGTVLLVTKGKGNTYVFADSIKYI